MAGKFCCSYEKYLDSKGVDAAYTDAVNGRQGLAYHGIPIVDVRLGSYLGATAFHQSFAMLTDRRNLVLAVNTADMPGNEVRMWYNPRRDGEPPARGLHGRKPDPRHGPSSPTPTNSNRPGTGRPQEIPLRLRPESTTP